MPKIEMLRNRKGFTLVEMMVVLVIIGILIGLALPNVLQSLKNRRVYDAARSVSSVIKSQRIRAQNLNVATGIQVDASASQMLTFTSTDSTCGGLVQDAGVAVDFANDHPDAAIGSSTFNSTTICIKPDGSVVDPSTGTAFTSGPVQFAVGRDDGIGKSYAIILPYNGLARLDVN